VATVPINLEYCAWFALINADNDSDTDPLTLSDHLLHKTWFLQIEEVDHRKCLIVTTKSNLPEAHAWMDNNLESLIRQSIPDGINPPTSQLPRRLDKTVYLASSQSYADVLKKQFSLAPNAMTAATDNACPPRKRQVVSIIDYDSDVSTETTSATTNATASTTTQSSLPQTMATTHNSNPAYATELQSIKMEINALKLMIADAVAQFKTAIASVIAPQPSPSDKDKMAHHQKKTNPNQTPIELGEFIHDLKYELATIITETRAMFQQQLLLMTNNQRPLPL